MNYSGPTKDQFQIDWADPIIDDNLNEDTVTIEPIIPANSEDSDEINPFELISLDEMASSDEPITLYRVQVGVFSNYENAKDFVSILSREDFQAYTQEIESDDGDVWKVFVGPFKSADAANSIAEELRSRQHDAFVN